MTLRESRPALPAGERFVRKPFSRHTVIDTRSPEEAYELVTRLSNVRWCEAPRDLTNFAMRASYFRFNHVDLIYTSNELDVTIGYGGLPQVRQQIGLSGAAINTIGNVRIENA